MIKKVIGKSLTSLTTLRQFASFKKYDYTDALNFKSLLNEEELMVSHRNIVDYREYSPVCADPPRPQDHSGLQGGVLRPIGHQTHGRERTAGLHAD
jgi:hypothetical protein